MKKYLIAGFGGQGVLFIGRILAQAGLEEDKQVTWLPSYGPEMRGGTANCSVIIAAKKIGSPIVSRPDIAVMMNTPSYKKFLPHVVPGGFMFLNSSIIPDTAALPSRADIRILRVPINEMAHEMGKDSVANIIMLGVIQAVTPVVSDAAIQAALAGISTKNHELKELNEKALNIGYQYGVSLG
ncbi:MAG: 2-oxoacid:acceptor oxidoreductase family protein [Peptococcaceae bacterium]|jgi:2-oxoglutarate ferredoxin oxidoreductase subunit gamma|nr:2-oxoacid:acceptor oxidoreductase family protein [Peptococcaceae bacterium]